MTAQNSNRVPQLQIPGKLYLRLHERATRVAGTGDPYELDLANALSHATVVRRGGGHQARIPMDPDQIDRLAMWLPEQQRHEFYRAADNLREQMTVDCDAEEQCG